MEPPVLRACTNVGLEEKRCDDDPITQDSAVFGDFDTHAQTERMQTGVCVTTLLQGRSFTASFKPYLQRLILLQEEECRLDMESLDIVQEEGITSSAYGSFYSLNLVISYALALLIRSSNRVMLPYMCRET